MATPSELLKRAERAEADKHWLEAAQLYERCGEVDRAISTYQKAGDADRACALLEATGRAAQAGATWMSVGQPLKAAGVFERIKEFKKAAQAYLRGNHRERAAAMYEKCEAFEDAAKVYTSLGNYKRALQLYAKAGNDAMVSELSARLPAEDRAAEQILELDPDMVVATDQYLDSGSVVDSVMALLRNGRAADAARVYGNCQEDIGYSIVAAAAGDRAVELKAAEMFYLAKDFAKSAQVLENLDDWNRAGAMYERADDPYMAGEMYARAGNTLKAAEMFEKHGNFQQAAKLYLEVKAYEKAATNFEKSVNNFVAGKLYFRLQKLNKSIQLLQKVQKSESEYFEACRMIGEILAANGHLDLAIKKYMEVVRSAELGDKTAPVYYALGRSLEQRGNSKQALELYDKLLAWDFNFQDVSARAQSLRNPATPSGSTQEPPLIELQSAEEETSGDGAVPRPLVSMMNGFDFLKGTPLFRDLSLDEMKAVYNACETRHFGAGDVLIEQDRPGEALFVLRKGTAQVVRVGKAPEVVATLGPGAPVGEMSLINDAPTSARVVAATEVDAFCVTRPQFEKLLALNDRMALKLYRFFVATLSERLRAQISRGAPVTSG